MNAKHQIVWRAEEKASGVCDETIRTTPLTIRTTAALSAGVIAGPVIFPQPARRNQQFLNDYSTLEIAVHGAKHVPKRGEKSGLKGQIVVSPIEGGRQIRPGNYGKYTRRTGVLPSFVNRLVRLYGLVTIDVYVAAVLESKDTRRKED